MQRLDIKTIATAHGLSLKQIAAELFPNNRHPKLALNRVISGDGALDENQIGKLAAMAGLSISDLYKEGSWTMESKEGEVSLTFGEFRAVLDTQNWVSRIYHSKSLFNEQIIHDRKIPLSAYIEMLNSEISKFTVDEQQTA